MKSEMLQAVFIQLYIFIYLGKKTMDPRLPRGRKMREYEYKLVL